MRAAACESMYGTNEGTTTLKGKPQGRIRDEINPAGIRGSKALRG
jgi:hypothetical protein